MNIKDRKILLGNLANSKSFIQSLSGLAKMSEEKSLTMQEIALWFYSSGYIVRMKSERKKAHKIKTP